MTEDIQDHERIEELLAAYTLEALSVEDAAAVDRLLGEHVPSCERCRATLRDFQEIGGELALAARPAEPPELMLRRLRKETRPALPKRRPALGWSAAVAVAAAVGLATWNTIALDNRVSGAEKRERGLTSALQLVSDPRVRTVPVRPRTAPRATNFIAAYVPGRQEMSVVGSGIPEPKPGYTYRLWLVQPGGIAQPVGDFHPDSGVVALYFQVDLAGYTGMLITEEGGPAHARPGGVIRWATDFAQP
jgi:Anti-sigma-K factor rskA